MTDEHVLNRGVGAIAKCRSCKQEIVFAWHAASGKNSPFQRDELGEWVIENGTARHVGKPAAAKVQLELGAIAPPAVTGPRFTSHFGACPKAGSWRKK